MTADPGRPSFVRYKHADEGENAMTVTEQAGSAAYVRLVRGMP